MSKRAIGIVDLACLTMAVIYTFATIAWPMRGSFTWPNYGFWDQIRWTFWFNGPTPKLYLFLGGVVGWSILLRLGWWLYCHRRRFADVLWLAPPMLTLVIMSGFYVGANIRSTDAVKEADAKQRQLDTEFHKAIIRDGARTYHYYPIRRTVITGWPLQMNTFHYSGFTGKRDSSWSCWAVVANFVVWLGLISAITYPPLLLWRRYKETPQNEHAS